MSMEFGLGSEAVWLQMSLIDRDGGPVVLPTGTVISVAVTVIASDIVIAGEVLNEQTGLCRFLMTSAVLGVVGQHNARIKAIYPSSGPKPVSKIFTITVS